MKKNSGKAPSIQFYYKDFMAEMEEHGPEHVGAWTLVLCKIWHENNKGSLTRTLPQFARIMHTSTTRANQFITYFSTENIATVTVCNGKITVVNRRAKRDANLKELNRLRQERHRHKDGKLGTSNGTVTPKKHHSSSSSSSSTTITTTKAKGKYTDDFENFWRDFKGRWNPDNGKHEKGGKLEASLEWKNLSSEHQKLATQMASQTGEQKTKDACRWLKYRRWEDFELPVAAQKPLKKQQPQPAEKIATPAEIEAIRAGLPVAMREGLANKEG